MPWTTEISMLFHYEPELYYVFVYWWYILGGVEDMAPTLEIITTIKSVHPLRERYWYVFLVHLCVVYLYSAVGGNYTKYFLQNYTLLSFSKLRHLSYSKLHTFIFLEITPFVLLKITNFWSFSKLRHLSSSKQTELYLFSDVDDGELLRVEYLRIRLRVHGESVFGQSEPAPFPDRSHHRGVGRAVRASVRPWIQFDPDTFFFTSNIK